MTYDSPYEDALNFAKLLPSFSNLISLTINAFFPDSAISDDLATICFHQHCPFLQRLYLHGNAFNRDSPMAVNVSMFRFPSLLYLHVGRIDFNLALQILDLYPQLRSFTANLHGPHTWGRNTVPLSIPLPAGIRTGLTAMKKLRLGDDAMFRDDYMSALIELLLPCCPNLRTFSFAFVCYQRTNRTLDPHWWTHVLASNNKLKRISVHLRVYGVLNSLTQEAVHAFQSLPFFVRLKVNVTYTAERIEFPHMFHIYAIETEEASHWTVIV